MLLLAVCLAACTAGANPSAPATPGLSLTPPAPSLPITVASSSHLYELQVPREWTAKLAATARDPDEISGPEGTITVGVSAIPVGIGAGDWIDSYLDIHAADFQSGCLSGGGAPQEMLSISGGDGRLLGLDCLPGWLLIVARDDRLYDLRFKVAGGATPAAKALFIAIGEGLVFLPGPIPSRAPTTAPSAA